MNNLKKYKKKLKTLEKLLYIKKITVMKCGKWAPWIKLIHLYTHLMVCGKQLVSSCLMDKSLNS